MSKKRMVCSSDKGVRAISNSERLYFGNERGKMELCMDFVEDPQVPGDSVFRIFVTVKDAHNVIIGRKAFSCLTSELMSWGCQA